MPTLIEVPLLLLEPAFAEHDSRADAGDVAELAASIRSVGLLQAVGVREREDSPGRFRIVFGHRRAAAVAALGWTRIPAVLIEAEASEDLLRSLVENVQRRKLSGADRAAALDRLLASGLTAAQIAEQTGKHRNIIFGWLKVARSKVLMGALAEGRVGINTARQLSALPEEQIARVLPELAGQTEPWQMARVSRAVDEMRTSPPSGFYAANARSRTVRSLKLVLEHMRGVKEIQTHAEVDIVHDIVTLAQRWQRDLQRAGRSPPRVITASCLACGDEQTAPEDVYRPPCRRCGGRMFTVVPLRHLEAVVYQAEQDMSEHPAIAVGADLVVADTRADKVRVLGGVRPGHLEPGLPVITGAVAAMLGEM